MRLQNPFHEGELLVQQRAGETAKGEQNGRIIADSIVKGAFKFIEQQSMVILGSVDEQHNVWASILLGHPGFIRVIDPQTVEIDLKRAFINKSDRFLNGALRQRPFGTLHPKGAVSLMGYPPCEGATPKTALHRLWTNIKHERIGMLVIELASRRRLRINGAIYKITPNKLRLQVTESYPNCPKYIQRRQLSLHIDAPRQSYESQSGQILTPEQEEFIRSADTFFVASFHASRGVDVSHRGGNPGFIKVLNRQILRIPDYIGNGMFNTLGNLAINPHAGLIFIDFDRSRTLQLIGRANILWDLEDLQHKSGTKRYWDFKIEQWLETDLPVTFNCKFLDYSPYNPRTA